MDGAIMLSADFLGEIIHHGMVVCAEAALIVDCDFVIMRLFFMMRLASAVALRCYKGIVSPKTIKHLNEC